MTTLKSLVFILMSCRTHLSSLESDVCFEAKINGVGIQWPCDLHVCKSHCLILMILRGWWFEPGPSTDDHQWSLACVCHTSMTSDSTFTASSCSPLQPVVPYPNTFYMSQVADGGTWAGPRYSVLSHYHTSFCSTYNDMTVFVVEGTFLPEHELIMCNVWEYQTVRSVLTDVLKRLVVQH